MPADIILYAIIAAGLVLWLRSILGTRNGAERERPNPFAAPLEKPAAASAPAEKPQTPAIADASPVESQFLPKYFTIAEKAEEPAIDIAQRDRSFSLVHFANGVADAFAYVVEAFAEGDRPALKELLAPKVYDAFDAAIGERMARGESVSTEIHTVRKVELTEALIREKMIYLSVRITADETCVIRDKDGVILSGDPDRVTEMVDMWTFGRALKSKDPRWLVYETSDGDVIEDHKTPVPDTHR